VEKAFFRWLRNDFGARKERTGEVGNDEVVSSLGGSTCVEAVEMLLLGSSIGILLVGGS
jgi:hypothetical protein